MAWWAHTHGPWCSSGRPSAGHRGLGSQMGGDSGVRWPESLSLNVCFHLVASDVPTTPWNRGGSGDSTAVPSQGTVFTEPPLLARDTGVMQACS